MRIGLWSDSVKFPSLPLMKISAFHKSLGDDVELIIPEGHYDKAYLSKVFNLPSVKRIPKGPPSFYADEIEKGGTGYAIDIIDGKEVFNRDRHFELPNEIEHIYPDYSLYPEFTDTAYGFLTRGCCNACGFCIVSAKEGRCSRHVADLDEFWRGQDKIKLLDPNILACTERMVLLNQLVHSKARIDFTQGLDARFINKEVVDILNRMKIQSIHFAFDFMKNEKAILRGLSCFNDYYEKSRWNLNCYILTNYDTTPEEDWYRVRRVQELGFHPDVRIYQKGSQSQFISDLARWSNNRFIFKSTSFQDYVPRKDGKSCRELYPEILKEKEFFIMAPKKTENAAPAIEIKDMNVWQKLQAVRMEFLAAGSKKSGKNLHAEFTYFELVDIVPQAEALFTKYHLSLIPSFGGDMAIADIVNTDDPQQRICFSIPIRFIAEPAKFRMNEVQGVGAVVTYYRRYLYMLVLDLVESDGFDGLPVPEEDEGQDTPSPKATKTPEASRPVTPAERKEITEQLTGSEEMASEEEISELKEKLKLLLELDPEQESFIQEIALKTNSFQEIKRVACLALTENVADMLDGYTSQEG